MRRGWHVCEYLLRKRPLSSSAAGTHRRCNSPQHKIKGLFYPFITVCYRVEQMSFHSAVLQQEQGTHSQSMVGCQNKSKTFSSQLNAQRHMFWQTHMWGLNFQCGKNWFDHKYHLTLPKIILLILLCAAKTERVKQLTDIFHCIKM